MKRTALAKFISVGLLVALLAGLFVALPGSVAHAVVNPPDYCIVSGITVPAAANGTYLRNGIGIPPTYSLGVDYGLDYSKSYWWIDRNSGGVWAESLYRNSTASYPPASGWTALTGTGTPNVVCAYGTPPVVPTEPQPTPEPTKSPVTYYFGDGQVIDLSCKATLSFNLSVPGGDMALLSCPVSGLGSNNKLTQDELPGGLPGGTFVAGMDVEISGGGTPMILTPSPWIVTFKMPEGATANQLAILFWDKSNNQWVELPAAVNLLTDKFTDLGNGRKVLVGTHQYTRTHVSATVNFTGTFVLIKK